MRYSFIFCILLLPLVLTAQLPAVFDSLQLVHSDTLYFASDDDKLSTASKAIIDALPVNATPSYKVYLTGHTDNLGSTDYNEALAIRRANCSAQALIENNWDSTQLIIQTFGETNPTANNNYESGRRRNRRVTLDFYRAMPYRDITGKLTDPSTGEPIPNGTVRIMSRSFSDTTYTDEEGRFSVDLPIDTVVNMEFYAKGYFFTNQILKVSPRTLKEIPIELEEATEGKIVTLRDLFFVGGKAILLPKSEPELPKILRFMQINPHLKIEIAGHVNEPNQPPVTEDSFSWNLSLRRAKLVHDYLLENGIPAEQLTYQPYGNHEMKYPRARSETEMVFNRRVEIRILEVFSE